MTISFTVPGKPVPMARPRVTSHGTYTPAKCKEYKEAVAIVAKAAMRGRKPLTGVISCDCYFVFEPPKSTPKGKIIDMIHAYHTTKPDTDNLLKAITDSLSGIVYVDDKQIAVIRGEKRYGYPARAEVEISEEES